MKDRQRSIHTDYIMWAAVIYPGHPFSVPLKGLLRYLFIECAGLIEGRFLAP